MMELAVLAFVPLINISSSSLILSWTTSAASPNICKAGYKGGACGLGNSLEILLLAPPDSHGACLNKVLQAEVIDTSRGQDHICSCCKNLVDSLFGNVALPVPHLVQLVGVGPH